MVLYDVTTRPCALHFYEASFSYSAQLSFNQVRIIGVQSIYRVKTGLPVSYTHLDVYKRQVQEIPVVVDVRMCTTGYADAGFICVLFNRTLLITFHYRQLLDPACNIAHPIPDDYVN